MVGDPVQLPATVMSKRAVSANFQRSLFKRLQDAKYPVHVLQVQYRMNPEISRFASETFYQGHIEDGPDVKEQTERPFHKHPALGPLTFLNVDGKESTPVGSSSICNHAECDMVLALIQCLSTQVQPSLRLHRCSAYRMQPTRLKVRGAECFKHVLPCLSILPSHMHPVQHSVRNCCGHVVAACCRTSPRAVCEFCV